MNTENALRELEKIEEAISLALEHHSLLNEANAKLHDSERVMYSPLTNKLFLAEQAVRAFRNELGE